MNGEKNERESAYEVVPQTVGSWRKKIFTAIRIIFGVGLFYYVVTATEGWSALEKLASNLWVVIGLISLPLFGASIEAHRMRVLFQSQDISLSFRNGFRIVAIGTMFNFCLPGGTGGDMVKLYYLAQENKGKGIEVATVVLVDRAVALLALLVLIVTLATLAWPLVLSLKTVQWLVGAAVLGIVALVLFSTLVWEQSHRMRRLMSAIPKWISLRNLFQRGVEAFLNFTDHKLSVMKVGVWSFFGHMMLAAMFIVSGSILIPEVAPLTTSLLALLGMLANALPVTPGGLGVGEAAFEGLFLLDGYVGGAQLILAWRLGMLPLCLVGCLLYIFLPQRKSLKAEGQPNVLSPVPHQRSAQ